MKYIKLLSLGLLCLSVGSCRQDDWAVSESQTGFYISLADADVQTETRSTPQELGKPTTDNFTLKIVNSASGKSIYDAGYTKDIIKASAGVYDVTASFGDNAVLAYDAPYYEGKKEDIAIEEGDTASVTVECAVANALASVTFEDSEKFKELYAECWLEVAVENSSLKLEDGDKRSAYYRANSKPTFTFKGVLKANGKSVEALLEDKILSDPATFAAKAHCRLTLALKEMVPGIIPSIVKAEVDTVTVSETLPMEWLPAPKVSATGFGENRTLDVYETAPTEASIDFTLSSPLQDIDFSVNFADENLQSLNGDYTLSALTNEQRLDFINAGIDIPIIGEDKPSVRFSKTLTGALLATNEGVVNNTFTLKSVKANDRTNADGALTYTIATHKPEFTVSVLPGNIWTKEFTVEEITVEEGKGNLDTLKENLIYQYSEDDGRSWKDLNDTRRQFFDVCPEKKSYLVRAVYRNEIVSEIDNVELEIPTQLPNSGMEDWYEEDQSDHKNLWFPYLQGEVENLWSTNNAETTNYRSASFCSTSAVKQSANKHNGDYAAWIRTVGHGIANTNVGSFMGINGSITGDHTIGLLTYSDEFTVRPTKLEFYYRYVPNGDDQGVIEVKIENQEQNIVLYQTSQTIDAANAYVKYELPIEYVNQNMNASHLTITFKSGSKHTDVVKAKVRGDGADEHYGSELYIDDISLVYDK